MGIVRFATTATITCTLLCACAPEKKPEGVIPEGYKSALDKAKGVEGKLEDAMQLQAQEIEQSQH